MKITSYIISFLIVAVTGGLAAPATITPIASDASGTSTPVASDSADPGSLLDSSASSPSATAVSPSDAGDASSNVTKCPVTESNSPGDFDIVFSLNFSDFANWGTNATQLVVVEHDAYRPTFVGPDGKSYPAAVTIIFHDLTNSTNSTTNTTNSSSSSTSSSTSSTKSRRHHKVKRSDLKKRLVL